jgi:hypothetical protein
MSSSRSIGRIITNTIRIRPIEVIGNCPTGQATKDEFDILACGWRIFMMVSSASWGSTTSRLGREYGNCRATNVSSAVYLVRGVHFELIKRTGWFSCLGMQINGSCVNSSRSIWNCATTIRNRPPPEKLRKTPYSYKTRENMQRLPKKWRKRFMR